MPEIIKKSVFYFEYFSLLVGLYYLLKNKLSNHQKRILLIIVVAIIFETSGKFFNKNNSWLFNLSYLVIFNLLFYTFYKWNYKSTFLFWVSSIGYTLGSCMLWYNGIENYYQSPQTIGYAIGCFFVFVAIFSNFFTLLNSNKILNLWNEHLFLPAIGILFYYIVQLPHRLARYHLNIPGEDMGFLIGMKYIFAILMYVLFSYSFICQKDHQ